MAPEVWRVRDRATFVELRRVGRKGRHGPVTVTWVPCPAPSRVAFAVDRRTGNAVARNRVRRQLRAAFRTMVEEVPTGAYLVRPAPAASSLDPATLTKHLRLAIESATDRP